MEIQALTHSAFSFAPETLGRADIELWLAPDPRPFSRPRYSMLRPIDRRMFR